MSKTVKGALPCGNPKRYTSSEVVQMQKHGQKSSHPSTASTSEEQSEIDQYIKTLLKRQTHTDVTLNQQFSKHRDFTESSSHAPSITQLQGLHNVDEHIRLDEFDSAIEYFKSCGLTRQEIAFKLKDKIFQKPEANHRFGAHPVSDEMIVNEIERKLSEKEEALKKPDKFNGGLELSRHALVLEKAILERQNKEGTLPKFVFTENKETVVGHPDDPINQIPNILSDIDPKPCREPRRERRKKRKLNRKLMRQQHNLGVELNPKARQMFMESVGLGPESSQSNNVDTQTVVNNNETLKTGVDNFETKYEDSHTCDSSEIDCKVTVSCVHGDFDNDDQESNCNSVPVFKKKKISHKNSSSFTLSNLSSCMPLSLATDEDIQANRLSLSEILSIDKFQHYVQGIPSKTVFVKNLPNNVTETDIASLFGRFEQHNSPSIQCRLLNGRMKGQAFVTFPDINMARSVIDTLNGYKLLGKPMILCFGKKQNDSTS